MLHLRAGERLVAILRAGFRDQVFAPLAGPNAKAFSWATGGPTVWTALTGWIPSDPSYFYGYLVRWLAVWPHSFGPLLVESNARQRRDSDCVCADL